MATGMILDGIFGSEAIDSSGEILRIEGADISDLEEGKGTLNWEHKSADDDSSNGQEVVGKITFAKKIFKESDCDNERQRLYWNKIKLPFIYGVARLYDGAGHSGAQAIAAQIRDHHANNEPILCRWSVEGSTTQKEGNVLKECVIRRVAVTIKPCNKTAISGLLEDPNAPPGFDKKIKDVPKDILASVADDARKFEQGGLRKLGSVSSQEYVPFETTERRSLVKSLVKLKALARVRKALTAGNMDVAPSGLSGGAALQREEIHGRKTRAMNVLRSYISKASFNKNELVAALKHELPEVSDDFINHFADVADDYVTRVRKSDDDGMPKLNPDAMPEKVKNPVDRSKETPGQVPPKVKGGLSMEAGGKLMLPPPGKPRVAGQPTPKRLALNQHFPDDAIYRAILKPHHGLEEGILNEEQFSDILSTIHDPWHRAMTHWMPLNNALHEGRVPKSIIAKSVIFAAMSPNTSVPSQERYYGHWMDMLNEGKVDPIKPISENAIKEFTARSTAGIDPIWNREYYVSHPTKGFGGQMLEDDANTDKGELPQIRGMRSAHLLFPRLEHLTAKYKDDTQGIAAELMNLKADYKRQHKVGHPELDGYGPKLTRYMLGMFGGGNMIVPDRHMIRSSFDLELHPIPGRENRFEGDPVLDKLQTSVFVDSKNEPLLRAMDHNFFTHHPAVRHVLETFPKHFQGREKQAIFPAFWLHWLTIGKYDQMRGRAHMGFNSDTDHRVFWDSVRDEMVKNGIHPHPLHEGLRPEDGEFNFGDNVAKHEVGLDPWPRGKHINDTPVWIKAAGALEAIRQRWGENPALMAFFSHIAPRLMAAETPVPPVQGVPHEAYHPHIMKAESLAIDLRKTISDASSASDPSLKEISPHIHHVYALRVNPDLKIVRQPVGRFMTAGGHLNILEDHSGDIGRALTEGPLTDETMEGVHALYASPRHEVASLDHILDGHRPELWVAPHPKPRPDSVFHYHRLDQTSPDVLEFVAGRAILNGVPMTHEQTKSLMEHAKNGHAVVRYKQDQLHKVQKAEAAILSLLKTDEDSAPVHAALSKLDSLVAQGLLEPHHADALRRHVFTDPMTNNAMGNKFAYGDFRSRAESKGGVHVMLDGHDMKHINDTYGHEVGDQAIRAMGNALRNSVDKTVGRGQAKLFRVGGDEFALHVPTYEHAAMFSRELRNQLESIPPVAGMHKLGMGVGFGTTPEEADRALYEAKKQKYDPEAMVGQDSRKWVSKYQPGTAPTMAHSLVPGYEGPVPLQRSELVKPPPAPPEKPARPEGIGHSQG